ncbi:extracellular solute-binding protein [Cohnella endophytica]|nr:extracellular solute-binding protein [Cohnella endophytica]
MKSYLKAASASLALMFVVSSLAACGSANSSNDQTAANSPSAAGSTSSASAPAEAQVYPENGLPTDQKVTLKVGFFEGGMGREWFDVAVESFKAKFPNVSFDVTSSPTISQVTQTKIGANDDKGMFNLFSGSIPGGIAPYVESGKLESEEDLWNHKAYDGNGKTLKELSFNGSFESSPRTAGNTYAFPISGSGSGLMYNKALFEKNGWDENPKTWSDFLKLSAEIKAAGITPITFPGVYADYITNAFGVPKIYELAEANNTLDQVQTDYHQFNTPYFLAPENIERWNRIYEMGKKGYFPAGLAAMNHTQSQMQVVQGKAAMVSTGTWVENEMKQSTPEDFKWGYMTVPFGDQPDSTKWTTFTPGSGFLIWAAKPDLEKAWSKEFIAWLWNLDNQQQIAEKGGMIPLRSDFADDPARLAKLQSLPSAFLDYAKNNKVKMDSGAADVQLTDPAFEQANKVISEAITQIATGKQDPLPILKEAEEYLKKAIAAQKK